MPRAAFDFTPVDPAPLFVGARGFDFTSQLATGETIASLPAPTVTIFVVSGVDTNPSSHLIGAPALSGNIVSQVIGTLVGGVVYNLVATVSTSSGGTRTLNAHLQCNKIS
jgi:hypothetical protein